MNVKTIPISQTLNAAISELKKITGASIKPMPLSVNRNGNPDAVLEIKLRKIQQQFFISIKNEVREHNINSLVTAIGSKKDQWLLVARYIPAPIKDFLKKHGYNYLEMTGNCFINTDQLFISVSDKEIKHVLKTPEGKLWKAAGLKFLFVILQDPVMLANTQREIAQAADIALGNISNLLEELRMGGYLVKNEYGELLQHRDKLIERWVEAFHITLRPKLQRGAFRFINVEKQKAWRDTTLTGIYWGGEPGADLYTNFLNPEHFTLYSSRPTVDLMKNLKIIADNTGNIIVLDKFWNAWDKEKQLPYAAPLLLVYAELKNSLDSRNWEAAAKIKNMLLDA
jgi:hypothetical protein